MSARRLTWLAVVASACVQPPPGAATPPRHYLEGSLGQVLAVGYDEASLQLTGEDVSLTFVRIRPLNDSSTTDGGVVADGDGGTTEDYPVKVTYAIVDGGTPELVRVDLTEVANGKQRGVVSRYVLNDPRRDFPPLSRGAMYFDRKLEPGAVVHGDFNCTFETGIEAASGRTVFGTFDAKVVQ